jgi:hypothetical protein
MDWKKRSLICDRYYLYIYTSIHDCNRSTFHNFQQGGEREREREMRLIGGRYVVKTLSDAKRLIKFTKKLKEVGLFLIFITT